MLGLALKPGAAALRRIIAAEKARFPELASYAYQKGWLRAVDALASVLRAAAVRQGLVIPNEKLAAELFLNLIMGPTSRAALYGVELDAEGLEQRAPRQSSFSWTRHTQRDRSVLFAQFSPASRESMSG